MWQRLILISILGLGLVAALPITAPSSAQQNVAPCGYVDGFDWPVPDIDLSTSDFGIYRTRFGGLHTGIDVAFDELGEPVRAAARGQVTYSDIAGWGTEKGVVVIQHTFPNGTLVNTLYGHMEELNGYRFPFPDQCVARGDIIGAIGAPTLSRPHLHYEIRTRYRYEGGPGYTETNPLGLGWLHPLDYTFLARVMIHPAYRAHFLLVENPTLPPLKLPNDTTIVAHSKHLEGIAPDGQVLWRFDTLGSITAMERLPDGRALFVTSVGQILVLQHGSYDALWAMPKPFITPPVVFGDAVVFMTDAHTLMALTPEGDILWETAPMPDRAPRWAVNGDRLAMAATGGTLWIIDRAGNVLHQQPDAGLVLPFAAPDGGFYLLGDRAISHLDPAFDQTQVVDTGQTLTPAAELLHDAQGTLYVYPGEGRAVYAYTPDGTLQWIAYMPGDLQRAPTFALGAGTLLYALTVDGQLLAYTTHNGRLAAQFALYDGGIDGTAAAHWLHVEPNDTVHVNSGYLSVVTLDGRAMVPAAD
jgi:murein DD-endopeptidase MepM/ murein hydrolase activator NlpD/outer membrane protein assembly factor BamB